MTAWSIVHVSLVSRNTEVGRPFEYVKSTYNVPAEIGRRVVVNGKAGTIVADRGHYIGVNFDHDHPGRINNCHPTWEVTYLDVDVPRKLTRSQRRYQRYLEVCECFDDFGHFLKHETMNVRGLEYESRDPD